MGHSTCCVVSCKNNGLSSGCKFYAFPIAKHKMEQRNQWIAAVNRKNPDGSPWCPKPWDVICSKHFIGNKKSEEALSPSYVPTIFLSAHEAKVANQIRAAKRYEEFAKQRIIQREPIIEKASQRVKDETTERSMRKKTCDQECQVDLFPLNWIQTEKIFICNRYIDKTTSRGDAEIQTEFVRSPRPVGKKFEDKQCGTQQKIFVNSAAGPNIEHEKLTPISFNGFSSIKNNDQLLELAGVTLEHFQFLLNKINDIAENGKVSKENRLFIFLVKMKTGLTFSAIGVLFSIHRTTVSRVFYSILKHLSNDTADLVFWPSKDILQGTIPEGFNPSDSVTRVIIDSDEFRTEIPASVDNRVYTYSHHKKGFTAKLLVAVTPAGFVSLK